jgi:hypothetical protein
LDLTTQKIVDEIHHTTPSAVSLNAAQEQHASTNAGLITWTIGNEVTDNVTKGRKIFYSVILFNEIAWNEVEKEIK